MKRGKPNNQFVSLVIDSSYQNPMFIISKQKALKTTPFGWFLVGSWYMVHNDTERTWVDWGWVTLWYTALYVYPLVI